MKRGCIDCEAAGRRTINYLKSVGYPDATLVEVEKYNDFFVGTALAKNCLKIEVWLNMEGRVTNISRKVVS